MDIAGKICPQCGQTVSSAASFPSTTKRQRKGERTLSSWSWEILFLPLEENSRLFWTLGFAISPPLYLLQFSSPEEYPIWTGEECACIVECSVYVCKIELGLLCGSPLFPYLLVVPATIIEDGVFKFPSIIVCFS